MITIKTDSQMITIKTDSFLPMEVLKRWKQIV